MHRKWAVACAELHAITNVGDAGVEFLDDNVNGHRARRKCRVEAQEWDPSRPAEDCWIIRLGDLWSGVGRSAEEREACGSGFAWVRLAAGYIGSGLRRGWQ